MEENGKLVSFIYADREVIAEEDEAGEHIRYIRRHEMLASDSERARTYYHYACDEMGSITDITDCHGTVLNHYAYDAFGNRTVEEETVENRFGFAGELLDAVTGQYYLRARFYNPVIARFLSEDTYYGDGLNLYAYGHNNPVRYVDPSGHEGLICSMKYGEFKKKEAEGGTLSEKEKRQIYEYEQNQKKSNGAGSDSKTIKNVEAPILPEGSSWERNVLNSFAGGKSNSVTYGGGTTLYNEIRYSQSSVNGSNDIIQSMRESGWKGEPIDVVEMPDGIYTTIDNTRVVSAREAGVNVKANVHGYNDPLPSEYIERFTTKKCVPKTWGEAIELRVGKQKASFRNGNPYGKFDMETIK